MPLDIQLFRDYAGGNSESIRESQRHRFADVEIVDKIIAEDTIWRRLTGDVDDLKKEKNKIQKEVGKKMKAKEPCEEMVAQVKALGVKVVETENQKAEKEVLIKKMISGIGNIVEEGVPISNDEDSEANGNRVEKVYGTPRPPADAPLNHHDLLWRIGGYEPERGTAVAGHRGYFLTGPGVLLNQAFQSYGTAFLREKGYTPVQPPYLMKKSIMAGVAQLEEFDEALYTVSGDDGNEESTEKYLIATSEQPLCGYHMGEWMEEKRLPIRYAGLSTCFRKEAGSHGKDTWGIFRVHQFEKVEQFVICEGDIDVSRRMHEEMVECAEQFYQSLGFPYQVINIVSGALNNAAIKKLDLECWFPGYNAYRELVSCSNCTDYQSRAMEIRCGVKKMGDREKKYVHMLNATLCATGRAICCLLENYQEETGVRIPEVLVPYMGGLTFLPFVRGSRDEKGPSKKGGEKKKDAPAPAAASTGKESSGKESSGANPPAAPAANTGSDPAVAALMKLIEAQGLQVRSLKGADPKDNDAITTAISELLSLKNKLKEMQGTAGGASGAAGSASSGGEKKEKKKKEKKEDLSKPPYPPILAPKYVTPAPSSIHLRSNLEDSLYNDDESINVVKVDARLRDYSYITGYRPGSEDDSIFKGLEGVDVTGMSNNIARWYKHMQSYSAEERAAW